MSAKLRPAGWGPHQHGWSNDACAIMQLQPFHELAWIWIVFLSEQRQTNDFLETAGRRATNNSLFDACASLKIVRNSFHNNVVAAPLRRCACTGAFAFLKVNVAFIKTGVLEHQCRAGVYVTQVFWNQQTHLRTHLLQGVHMRSCMRSLFISFGGRKWVSWTSLWASAFCTCRLAWGVIFDRRRDRGVVCVFSILLTRVGVYVLYHVYHCVCVCIRKHTHTLHMG